MAILKIEGHDSLLVSRKMNSGSLNIFMHGNGGAGDCGGGGGGDCGGGGGWGGGGDCGGGDCGGQLSITSGSRIDKEMQSITNR